MVEVKQRSTGKRLSGEVVRVHGNGVYDIQCDTGALLRRVKRASIKLLSADHHQQSNPDELSQGRAVEIVAWLDKILSGRFRKFTGMARLTLFLMMERKALMFCGLKFARSSSRRMQRERGKHLLCRRSH